VPQLELWWLGQAGFRLRAPSGGPSVFIDPFLSPHVDRIWSPEVDAGALAQADLLLVSHEHLDHLDRPILRAAAHEPGSRFVLVVPRPLRDAVIHDLGIPAERVLGAQPDEPIEQGGIRVDPVPARHGVNVADAYTFGQEISAGEIRYLGYVVGIDGVRVYHAGDCSPYPGQAEQLRALAPHIALLPINGRDFFRETEHNIVGNMDHREAARLASDIGVQLLIPMHWEMFARNRGYPDDLIGYATAEFPRLSVLTLGRGARFTFTSVAGS
jgi:L-ascorbate metabolism protein UlaG (beta-lactamase superfamily)